MRGSAPEGVGLVAVEPHRRSRGRGTGSGRPVTATGRRAPSSVCCSLHRRDRARDAAAASYPGPHPLSSPRRHLRGTHSNHCSAPYSSYRSTSVNPSRRASPLARSWAVRVRSTTRSPGSAAANQPRTATQAGGVTLPPRLGEEQVTEFDLPGDRTDLAPVLGVPPVERDHADHRAFELDHEGAGPPSGYLGHRPFEFGVRAGAAEVGAHLGRGEQLDEPRAVPRLGLAEHEPLGGDRGRRPGDGPELSHTDHADEGYRAGARPVSRSCADHP